MKYFSHLNTAIKILQQYSGQRPFDVFLKQFFSQYKKYGSGDRKSIARLCYGYFRTGKMFESLSTDEKTIASLYLCSSGPSEILQHVKTEWSEKTSLPLPQKLSVINDFHHSQFTVNDIFPWQNALSTGIEYQSFCASFLVQPDLFLRLRPGKE